MRVRVTCGSCASFLLRSSPFLSALKKQQLIGQLYRYHGGWLAPNIYFLGFAGSVLVDGWLRITGASGIYKSGDWRKGHFETVPFDDRTIKSVYHIREYDVARLLQVRRVAHIFLLELTFFARLRS
jgi:hypothetical protein